jgi:tetratricopeptide (TPR) repeat protein
MMQVVRSLLPVLLALLCSLAAPLRAQTPLSVAQHLSLGDSAHAALAPAQALQHYRAALAADSTNYAALWKAGRELVDIAKQIDGQDDSSKHRRDSLYVAARAYGEAAVRVNPTGAAGHFTIGQALGRLSRTKGGKERVRFAKIIYDEGMRAIELDSTHDGAYHLVGAWHAEVKRLSWIERKAAELLFSGGFLGKGNWDDAQRYLEKAVALKPQNVFHRLELGEVYVDVGKYSKAREQFTALDALPIADVLDPAYKKEAKQVLDDIRGEKDER